jgi:hypothetical protein
VAKPKSGTDYSVFGKKYIYFFQFYITPRMSSCTPWVTLPRVEDHCSGKCGRLNVSQLYGPLRDVTRMASPFQ